MSSFLLRKHQKDIDRALFERSLARAISKDLPLFYSRLREIALNGEDSDSLKSISTMLDRLLGKAHDFEDRPNQALTINIVNALGGSVSDYKLTRYGKTLGDPASVSDDLLASQTPSIATPSISSLPPPPV